MYVDKIYGNTGHTALWQTCKYRLIQHRVPVKAAVLYVVNKDIVFKEDCKLCLKKGDILQTDRFYLQKTTWLC